MMPYPTPTLRQLLRQPAPPCATTAPPTLFYCAKPCATPPFTCATDCAFTAPNPAPRCANYCANGTTPLWGVGGAARRGVAQ